MKKKSLLIVSMFLLFLCVRAFAASGGMKIREDFIAPKNDFYISFHLPHNRIDSGSLDGQSTYFSPQSTAPITTLVPSVNGAFGYGGAVGIKGQFPNERYAMGVELAFARSQHDAFWMRQKMDASLDSLSLNLYLYLWADRRLQPFVSVGITTAELKLQNGLLNAGIPADDARYRGAGWNMGGGFLYYLNRYLAVHSKCFYQNIRLSSIRNFEGGNNVMMDPTINTCSINFEVGFSLRVGR